MAYCVFIVICRKMSKSNSILAWFAAIALMALGQAAIAGPDNPGENHDGGDGKDGEGHEEVEHDLRLAWVKGKSEARVAVLWWRMMSEFDGKLAYDVQLRIRHEHEVGKWHHEVETIRNEIRVDGLKPGTTYDVRVRAWHGKKSGPWKIREKVFRTQGGEKEEGDHEEGDKGEGGEENGEHEGDKDGEGGHEEGGHENGDREEGGDKPNEGDNKEEGEEHGRLPVVAWIKGEANERVAEIWWKLIREVDGKVVYEVQLRKRSDGKAGEWAHEAETKKTEIRVDGLHPGKTYDVRVRGWLGDKPGKWKIREAAFRTKSGEDEHEGGEDGATGKPGEIKVGEVGERAAVIGWSKPKTPGDAKFGYDVQLRKRINGKPTKWVHALETAKNEVVLKNLSPGTLYEVRVRAWANKKPSAWRIREEAFKTKGKAGEDGEGEHSGVPQIAWIKADDIGPRAGVAKWALVRELDAKVAYDVQIRTRIEGKAGEWRHEAETHKSSIIIDGLKPNTMYEIRVKPWANKKAGAWKILEHAFRTRKSEGGDEGHEGGDGGKGGEGDKGQEGHGDGEGSHAPSEPGKIKVSDVTPNSAMIRWGASKAPGDSRAIYDVQIRQRINGKATKWRYIGETFETQFKAVGLEAGSLYDVRIRAWSKKKAGPWAIKENAFTTGGGEGEQTIDHAGRIEFQVIEGNQMRLMWPAGKGRFVVESSDRIGGGTWKTVEIRPIQVSQMMVIDLPLGRDGMQFFRVRN